MVNNEGISKTKSKVINPEVIEPEQLFRSSLKTVLSPDSSLEVVKQAFDSLKQIILNDEKVIEITKEVIGAEKLLSLEDKKNFVQYIDKLLVVFQSENSEKFKDLIWQEIVTVRKQLEEGNESRREFISNETKKIQEQSRTQNYQLMKGILSLTALVLGVGAGAVYMKYNKIL